MAPSILIVNDDGPDSPGLAVLRDSIKLVWPTAKPVVIVPAKPMSGISMAVSDQGWNDPDAIQPSQIDADFWTVAETPVEIIYRAFTKMDQFTGRPWDIVMSGVNPGANLGLDIFHSGTCGAAMIASTAFGCGAWAFSQDLPHSLMPVRDPSTVDLKYFDSAVRVLPDYLRTTSIRPGECFNINFPEQAYQGYKTAPQAHYSYHRPPPTSLIPRAAGEISDISAVSQGYVSITELALRVNTRMKY